MLDWSCTVLELAVRAGVYVIVWFSGRNKFRCCCKHALLRVSFKVAFN